MLIYKIFRDSEYQELIAQGTTLGAPIDLADGYIHFSTAPQAAETAAKHFVGADDLWLLSVNADLLGDHLRWEISRGDTSFPHLYAPLSINNVQDTYRLPLGPDGHIFTKGFE